jgi:hypothetical protein
MIILDAMAITERELQCSLLKNQNQTETSFYKTVHKFNQKRKLPSARR